MESEGAETESKGATESRSTAKDIRDSVSKASRYQRYTRQKDTNDRHEKRQRIRQQIDNLGGRERRRVVHLYSSAPFATFTTSSNTLAAGKYFAANLGFRDDDLKETSSPLNRYPRENTHTQRTEDEIRIPENEIPFADRPFRARRLIASHRRNRRPGRRFRSSTQIKREKFTTKDVGIHLTAH